MPYKNPEDKQKWEREHRAQRNTQRRNRRSGASHSRAELKRARALGSTSVNDTKSGWKPLVALAIGLGAVVLGLIGGLKPLPQVMQRPNRPE